MSYLTILGKKKKIPPYPHHKNYVYRCYRFFEVKSLYSFLTINGKFRLLKEFFNNRKYKCSIPRDLLIDPTSACNLKCTGCWAADYERNSHLSYEKLDEVLTDAYKLGVMDVLLSGGEPLMRKDDVLKLCEKHNKLTYGIFTNGTLIDEKFADELARLGHVNVFVSIEGFKEDTDFRRGEGTYDKVIKAMEILKERDIGFGFSVCYHAKNYKTIISDEFLDFIRDKGAWFGWLFNYIPVGKGADTSLCLNAQQRKEVMLKLSDYMKKNKFALIDFANSGHKSIGCVGAGNDFVHINANGDLEPCAFCHYSDTNIKDKTLLEALQSPFFKRFRTIKPFSKNFLRPCPMVDVPDEIVKLCKDRSVKSTHLFQPETAEELVAKTRPFAEKWEPVANQAFKELPKADRKRFGILTKLVGVGNDIIKN